MRSADRAAALKRARSVAARQHGVLLTRQLEAAGFTAWHLRRLTSDGSILQVRRGVWLLEGGAPSEWQEAIAALLVCGPDAALSHATAARVHRIPGIAPTSVLEVTIPADWHRALPGVVVHRSRTLRRRDVRLYRGARVTTPARTLVDLAVRLPPGALAKVLDEGMIATLWRGPDLRDALDAAGGPGAASRHHLGRLLDQRGDRPAGESHLEARAIRALASLGPFVTGHQVVLDGQVFVLDIAWPDYRVVAECDGWTVRSRSRGKFDHDRRRGNLLEAHGWAVVHLTTSMSDDEMRAAVFRLLMAAAGRTRTG